MVDAAAGRRLAVDELTDSQKMCLRLVKDGLTSKEIARKTGLSPQTVDQYMSRAAAQLGATSRFQAADLLAEIEIGMVKMPELRVPEVVLDRPLDPPNAPPAGYEGNEGRPGEERSKSPLFIMGKFLKSLFYVPPVGGRRHALDWTQKTAVIIRVALTALVAASAVVSITRGLVFLLKN